VVQLLPSAPSIRCAFFSKLVLSWRIKRDREVRALRVSRLANVVMVTRAYQTNIAKIHVARHPFDGQFTLPVLHKPKFVMEMGLIGFVERSNFLICRKYPQRNDTL